MRNHFPNPDETTWLHARERNINSTEVASLFGIGKFMTPFELWHIKNGNIDDPFKSNVRVEAGKRLERVIGDWILEKLELKGGPFNCYIEDRDKRIGSTFDFEIPELDALLEVKNVDYLVFRDEWHSEGDIIVDAPLHIEMQVQHQMLLSGKKKCLIGILVGGNTPLYLWRDADPKVHEAIVEAVAKFWESKTPPPPDYEADWSAINSLFARSEEGLSIEATDEIEELSVEYAQARVEEKAAALKKKVARAKMLELIGDAERVYSPTVSISAREIREKEVQTYTRKAYRGFSLKVKEAK